MKQNSGFKILAMSPVLKKIADEMREKQDREKREARERIERARAALAQPALDLGSKLSTRIRQKMGLANA